MVYQLRPPQGFACNRPKQIYSEFSTRGLTNLINVIRPYNPDETGFTNTLEWFLNNESWWQAVLDGSCHAWVEKHYGAA